jgi:hypothetical protein
MSISAMKQALEALERADKINGYANNKKAITALRHAIEQAESLDKLVAENQRLGLYDAPVAWIKKDELAYMSAVAGQGMTEWQTNLGLKPEPGDVPLYTTCQQNRQVAKSATTDDETPPCKTHPDAPHGFDRNASHSADRYVCECEGWEPPKKEWVGFTHEELAWLNEALNLGGRFAVIEAIEAKLREKNA